MPVPLSSLSPAPAESAGQLWLADEIGGLMYSPRLSKKLRMGVQKRCRYRQFCDLPEPEQQVKHEGDTFSWNIHGRLETRGRRITELEDAPRTRAPISQGKVTVTEWMNSVPCSRKLLDLAAEPVEAIVKKQLEIDCAETLDGGAHDEFAKTPIKVGPAAGNSATEIAVNRDGTAPSVNNQALTLEHVVAIALDMRENDIPTYDHGDYYALGRPTTYRTIQSQLEQIHQYTESGLAAIRMGEKGRHAGVRFVEQTGQAKSALFATNDKSDEAFFFGEDGVTEAVVIPEEVQTAIPSGFGRNRAIGWYYLGEFALTYTAPKQARVYHWTSLAA